MGRMALTRALEHAGMTEHARGAPSHQGLPPRDTRWLGGIGSRIRLNEPATERARVIAGVGPGCFFFP